MPDFYKATQAEQSAHPRWPKASADDLNVRQQSMDSIVFPDLSHKLLTVHIIGDQHNYIVDNPRFEKQGGRWFMVGNTPKGTSTGDWDENIEVAIAWDQISAYRVFESVDQYVARYAKYKEIKKRT